MQTFTEQIRFIWNTIIKRNGIEIDETMSNPSQKHLTVLEYKNKKLQEEINAQKQKLKEMKREIYIIYINQYREDFNDLRPVFENER